MTLAELKEKIISSEDYIHFKYKGKNASIRTYSNGSFAMLSVYAYSVFNSVDEVITDKFFDGKSLVEIHEEIKYIPKEEITNLEIILDNLMEYSHSTFDYNGKHCGVDPYHDHYSMWYGEDIHYRAKSIDEVINYKLFDGKSLKDIANEVELWW